MITIRYVFIPKIKNIICFIKLKSKFSNFEYYSIYIMNFIFGIVVNDYQYMIFTLYLYQLIKIITKNLFISIIILVSNFILL